MTWLANGEVIVLKENEGIIVNARQLHFGFSEERKECDFICILLHPLMLCTTSAYERDFVLPVLHNRNAAFIYKILACQAFFDGFSLTVQTMVEVMIRTETEEEM